MEQDIIQRSEHNLREKSDEQYLLSNLRMIRFRKNYAISSHAETKHD